MANLATFLRSHWYTSLLPGRDATTAEPRAATPVPGGIVHLVGAGPGDPELLTRKAWRLLQEADVLVYDALVSPAILAEIPPRVRRCYVGKRKGHHAMGQQDISRLLVTLARQGHRVVRLKGGDPLVFGRLREELDALQAAGIPLSIVPGITAAAGCAASAGLPLTERQLAPSVRFIATHSSDGRLPDWATLARHDETLVFYMGLSMAQHISTGLQAHGLPHDWPVLIVENGTLPQERRLATTLAQLPDVVAQHRVQSPALIFVGEVVRSRADISACVATALQD